MSVGPLEELERGVAFPTQRVRVGIRRVDDDLVSQIVIGGYLPRLSDRVERSLSVAEIAQSERPGGERIRAVVVKPLCMALEAMENQPEPVELVGWL